MLGIDTARRVWGNRKKRGKGNWGFVIGTVKGCCLIMVPGWLFFQSVPIALALLLFLPLYWKRCQKEREKERQRRLNQGFADALSAFAAALEAGYSAENAITETCKDLALIYPEEEPIQKELYQLQRQLKNNRSLEQAFADMAARTGDEDIQCFAEVFEIAKRSGGDLIQVIKAAERNIAEREEVKREIRTMMSAKRLEANIMNLMPCGILFYFVLCDPGYLKPLYEGTAGRGIMAGLLVAYLGCIRWAAKITEINV